MGCPDADHVYCEYERRLSNFLRARLMSIIVRSVYPVTEALKHFCRRTKRGLVASQCFVNQRL